MTTDVVHCATFIHADNHYHRSCATLFCSTDSTYINCVLSGPFLLALAILNRYVTENVKFWHVTEDKLPPPVSVRDFYVYITPCHTMILNRSLIAAREHNKEQIGPTRHNGWIKRNDFRGVIFYSLPPKPFSFLYRDHQLTTNIKPFYFATETTVFVRTS